jgi:hypothetical protein
LRASFGLTFDIRVEFQCLLAGGPGLIVMTHGGQAFREQQPGAGMLRLQTKAGSEVRIGLGWTAQSLANGAAIEVEARILRVRLDLLGEPFQRGPQLGWHTAKSPEGQIDGDSKTESQVESQLKKIQSEEGVVHERYSVGSEVGTV